VGTWPERFKDEESKINEASLLILGSGLTILDEADMLHPCPPLTRLTIFPPK
jgi:hypothetical protein